jgi:hypothetical protein
LIGSSLDRSSCTDAREDAPPDPNACSMMGRVFDRFI